MLAFLHDAYRSDKDASGEAAAHAPHHKRREDSGMQLSIVTAVSVIATVAMVYVCYEVNIKPWSANALLLDGLRPQIVDAKGKVVTQTAEAKFEKVKASYERGVLSNAEPLEQLVDRASELFAQTHRMAGKGRRVRIYRRGFCQAVRPNAKGSSPIFLLRDAANSNRHV